MSDGERKEEAEPAAGDRRLGLLGFLIATWSSMCGIGGGLFAVPMLHYLERLPLREAVATSLGLVVATTSTATVTELFLDAGALRWGLVAALAAGSLVGADLGFRAAQRVQVRPLKVVFALLLLFVGTRLVLSGAKHEAGGELPALVLGAREYVFAGIVGVAAGFLAPLLGIGGGLVAVPALLYGVAGLGYLGARACSLAMAVVSSVHSLRLYARTGLVHPRKALWIAGGAVLGAVVGSRLVYVPAVEGVARRMLGATLLWVALRFGYDALRGKAQRA